MRRVLSMGDAADGTEQMISMLAHTKSNEEFLQRLQDWQRAWEKQGYKMNNSRY